MEKIILAPPHGTVEGEIMCSTPKITLIKRTDGTELEFPTRLIVRVERD